jgi:hypothetical protein
MFLERFGLGLWCLAPLRDLYSVSVNNTMIVSCSVYCALHFPNIKVFSLYYEAYLNLLCYFNKRFRSD